MADQFETRTAKTVERGRADPLGATLTATGVNFALYSKNATEVYVLLLDVDDGPPTDVIRLEDVTRHVWHAHVRGVRAGQRYGYRVRGPYRPEQGLRFDEHKLLLAPYAKALTGPVRNTDNVLLAYDPSPAGGRDLSFDTRDSAVASRRGRCVRLAGRCIAGRAARIVDRLRSPRQGVHRARVVRRRASGHVSGLRREDPHLVRLGVNAVELLPVHEFYVDDFLLARGLTNYRGYNTIRFFAPTWDYGPGGRAWDRE